MPDIESFIVGVHTVGKDGILLILHVSLKVEAEAIEIQNNHYPVNTYS